MRQPTSPPTPALAADPDPAAVYARWAAASLVLTVALGAWLRLAMRWPELAGDVSLAHAVHAHSHTGFFGWAVLGLAAALARRSTPSGSGRPWLRRHAHVTGAATVAAMLAFAWQGYGSVSIPLSALHVALWGALAWLLWPRRGDGGADAPLWRLALAALLLAGGATVLPVVLRVRGVESGWAREAGIQLFLSLFVQGWMGIGTLAVLARRLDLAAALRPAGWLMALGAPAATLLHVAAPPPWPWLVAVGRAGTALVAAGMLLAARAVLRARPGALLGGTGVAAGVAGTLALGAALGLGGSLLHARSLIVAYVHLLLLGVATPVLLDVVRRPPLPRPLVLAAQGGVAAMLLALGALGWPPLGGALAAVGLGPMGLLAAATAGGVVAALALVGAVTLPATGVRRPDRRGRDLPIRPPTDVTPRPAAAPRRPGPVATAARRAG